MKTKFPVAQLDGFIAKYLPEMGDYAYEVLAKMRSLLPGAVEMVYDNYNGLVIGFGPTERPSEALFSMIVLPQHISVCFLTGAKLKDPKKILRGSGNIVRHIRLEDVMDLDKPEVRSLMQQAIKRARWSLPKSGAGPLIIKSISAKQRPRRPSSKTKR
jgi:hypothetical protein